MTQESAEIVLGVEAGTALVATPPGREKACGPETYARGHPHRARDPNVAESVSE